MDYVLVRVRLIFGCMCLSACLSLYVYSVCTRVCESVCVSVRVCGGMS
jgi:hypothetical protein